MITKQPPQEIRKACMILGIATERMSVDSVIEAWKQQIVQIYPDLGVDHEAAVFLNSAKDIVIRWLVRNEGENFPDSPDRPHPAPVPRKPAPVAGSTGEELPVPEVAESSD